MTIYHKMLGFRVGFYRGRDFFGVIACALGRLDLDTADVIAARYNMAYPYNNGTFRVIEVNNDGYIVCSKRYYP